MSITIIRQEPAHESLKRLRADAGQKCSRKRTKWTHYLEKPKSPSVFFFLLLSVLRGTLSQGRALCNYTVLPYKTRMSSRYN